MTIDIAAYQSRALTTNTFNKLFTMINQSGYIRAMTSTPHPDLALAAKLARSARGLAPEDQTVGQAEQTARLRQDPTYLDRWLELEYHRYCITAECPEHGSVVVLSEGTTPSMAGHGYDYSQVLSCGAFSSSGPYLDGSPHHAGRCCTMAEIVAALTDTPVGASL